MLDKIEKVTAKNSESPDVIHHSRLGEFSSSAAKYTSSIDIDPRIFDSVIEINMAHAILLAKNKIISEEVSTKILYSLARIPNDLNLNEFLEDVHMNIEDYVIREIGSEAGGMMNLGKSRNDQVTTALRMTLRSDLILIMRGLTDLERILLNHARKAASVVMPGYTHLQRAQPVTLGHHLLAHEEALERDSERMEECYSRVNRSPMGAAALATSRFSSDRGSTARILGFDGVVENSIDAVGSRDFAIESIYICSQIMSDLSQFAEEIIYWTSKEYDFAEISARFAATSSLMPQKKNAIIPEIARARAAQVTADLIAALNIMKALPLSYNLDIQELTRNLWSAIDKTVNTLSIFKEMLAEMEFKTDNMRKAVESDETLFATELADYLVSNFGFSFRQAHARVGALVKRAEESGHLSRFISKSSQDEISKALGIPILKQDLIQVLDPDRVLEKRRSIGSPNPAIVKESCRNHARIISSNEHKRKELEHRLIISKRRLRNYLQDKFDLAERSMKSGKIGRR